MKILTIVVLFISSTVFANQSQVVDGNYLRYEETEYESMFFPCHSAEVWSLNGGEALDTLVDYYRNSRTNSSGEMRVTLNLNVIPVDKADNPGSQIDAVAKVIAIVSISEDENEIASCRQASS